jgi:hypothetical protein
MSIRDLVIKVLRMVGGAFVGTVHDRLTTLECKLDQIIRQQDETATSLLQGCLHLIELHHKSEEVYSGQLDVLLRHEALLRELRSDLAKSVAQANDWASQSQLALLRSSSDRIDLVFAKLLEELAARIDNARALVQAPIRSIEESITSLQVDVGAIGDLHNQLRNFVEVQVSRGSRIRKDSIGDHRHDTVLATQFDAAVMTGSLVQRSTSRAEPQGAAKDE